MERGVLEEQVHDEAPADDGVHDVTGLDYALEVAAARDHDECSDLLLAHYAAGFGDLYCRVHHYRGFTVLEESVEEAAPSGGLGSEAVEDMPDLRLEYDDDGQNTYVEDGFQQGCHHLHVQRLHDDAHHQQEKDGDEYLHSGGAPDPPEKDEQDSRYHQDIENIRQGHM